MIVKKRTHHQLKHSTLFCSFILHSVTVGPFRQKLSHSLSCFWTMLCGIALANELPVEPTLGFSANPHSLGLWDNEPSSQKTIGWSLNWKSYLQRGWAAHFLGGSEPLISGGLEELQVCPKSFRSSKCAGSSFPWSIFILWIEERNMIFLEKNTQQRKQLDQLGRGFRCSSNFMWFLQEQWFQRTNWEQSVSNKQLHQLGCKHLITPSKT